MQRKAQIMTTMTAANSPFYKGPLTRKLPRKTRREAAQLKMLLIRLYQEELSERYGDHHVDRWMKQIIRYLSQF